MKNSSITKLYLRSNSLGENLENMKHLSDVLKVNSGITT